MPSGDSDLDDVENEWGPFPALSAARAWSLQRVEDIRLRLAGLDTQIPVIRCVVLTGSLARLDACPRSDVDLIIVLDDQTHLESHQADEATRATWNLLAPLGLRRPQSRGVFASPTSRRQLCDGPRGIVSEAVGIFGKRIQLLLESRPVFGAESCMELQLQILLRYAGHPFANRSGEFWNYLMDDLMRYWRSYRVWRHWDDTPENGGWYLRNLKLRYSRLLTYASLLLACAIDSLDRPSVESLFMLLPLTPLERIRQIDQRIGARMFASISRKYDRFVQVIGDTSSRDAMEQAAVTTAQEALTHARCEFTELLDNADELRLDFVRMLFHLPPGQRDPLLSKLVF